MEDKLNIVEAVLFAAGESVSIKEFCSIFDMPEGACKKLLAEIVEKYNNSKRGLKIIRLEDSFQLCTREEFHAEIEKLVAPRMRTTLSLSAMETLSIVAYNQPVTRSGIEYIRGVNSDYAVEKLIEKGLIIDCGRLDTPGKPLLYKTTDEFLRCFGLGGINELPKIDHVPLQLTFQMKE